MLQKVKIFSVYSWLYAFTENRRIAVDIGPRFARVNVTTDFYKKIESGKPRQTGSQPYLIRGQCQVDKIVVK